MHKYTNKLHIDDNIFLFDKLEKELNSNDPYYSPYNVYIHITRNSNKIVSKMIGSEIVYPIVNLYFENYITLRIKKINNNVSEYQMFLNVVTYKNFINNDLICEFRQAVEGSNIFKEICRIICKNR